MKNNLIEQCQQKSIELLTKNSCKFGILASSLCARAQQRNYLSVFARDASICSLGMLTSGDKKLIHTVKKSLLTLGRFQARNGQIPNYVKPEINYINFWRMGCIDATLWWLIAIKYYEHYTGDKKFILQLKNKIKKAIIWLSCQEHPIDKLLIQNEASDWADIMPRSGRVLYTNALWYKVKILYKIKDAQTTKENFNAIFYPFDTPLDKFARHNQTTIKAILSLKKKDHYLSFVNYLFWGDDFDVYAHSLAIVFDVITSKHQKRIVKNILEKRKLNNLPVPVLFNPISKKSKLWRRFMESHNQNYPYKYHNGGIWPFAACFFVLALAKIGERKQASTELEKIAYANSLNNWQFNEWLHGKTGKPMGMPGQSWNAGAFIFAKNVLDNKQLNI